MLPKWFSAGRSQPGDLERKPASWEVGGAVQAAVFLDVRLSGGMPEGRYK